jgi:phage-related protein
MRYELRRPEADYLRDGVYELRIRHLNTNYRLLYFFHENKAVLFTGLLKEREIPPKEINLAIQAKFDYMESPRKHTFEEDSYEG